MKMKSKKVTRRFRAVFIWTCIVGILFNLIFDLFAIQRLKQSGQADDLVFHTYEVTLHLQRLDRALELLLIPPTTKSEFENVFAEIDQVKALVRSPRQQELLQKLIDQIHPTKGNPTATATATATATVAEMLSAESGFLEERLRNNRAVNQGVDNSLLAGLIVDGVLLMALLAIFLLDLRARRKIELNLIESMNNLRATNLVLQEEHQKRQVALKATVHDLKNPLGTIRGFAELITDERSSSDSIQEFSETIKRVSQNSLNLVDSLLYSQESAPLRSSPLDLVGLLDEICTQMEVQAKAKGQTITTDFSAKVAAILGNELKLDELVTNLLSNAIKYSPRSSKIWVRCSSVADRFRVEIEDQGPGFTEDDKAKAFQYGQRLSARPTENESSTGYGLFIAKQIVELHKGCIKICDGRSGKGACVFFEIPAFNDKAAELPS